MATELFGKEDYRQLKEGETYENKFVVVEPDFFKKEYRNMKNQLFLAQGGFGCDPTKLGGKIFGRFYDEKTHIRREFVLGVATEEAIKKWEKTYDLSREEFTTGGQYVDLI